MIHDHDATVSGNSDWVTVAIIRYDVPILRSRQRFLAKDLRRRHNRPGLSCDLDRSQSKDRQRTNRGAAIPSKKGDVIVRERTIELLCGS